MKHYIIKFLTVFFFACILHVNLPNVFVPAPEAAPGPGDGNLLKRAPGETCEGCHRTNLNTPSPGEPGYDQTNWNNAIKMHSGEIAGSCSDATYKTKSACENNSFVWTFDKWDASGGWGVAGGQYGEFTCTTCHTPHDTVNIYLIKETVTAPNSPTNDFPGSTIDFRLAIDSTPGTQGIMGDDSTTHSTSVAVCEVCHSYDAASQTGVKQHAYNMGVTTSHQNAKNCTTSACHSHKLGFRIDVAAACGDCHGAPPSSSSTVRGSGGLVTGDPVVSWGVTGRTSEGAHVAHKDKVVGTDCSYCHYGGMSSYTQGSGQADSDYDHNLAIGFYAWGADQAGTYNADVFSNGYTLIQGPGTTTSIGGSAGPRTCGTIYCHSDVQPDGGGAATPNYSTADWDDPATGQCGTCHNADGVQGDTSLMATGSHTKHVELAGYNMPCSNCHDGAGSPQLNHVNNYINVNFDVAYGGAYSGGTTPDDHTPGGGYGSCSANYCHSQGTSTYQAPNEAPAWGTASTGACGDCHGVLDSAPPFSTPHTTHVGTAANYIFACSKCHDSVVNTETDSTTQPTFKALNLHVNTTREVVWDNTNSDGDVYSSPNCSNIYCHSQGQAGSAPYNLGGNAPNTAAAWNNTFGSECIDCHNGDASANGGASFMNTNNHSAHVNNASVIGVNFTCDKCHSDTVALDTNRTIGTQANHVNKEVNVVFTDPPNPLASYSGSVTPGDAVGTCDSLYCHSIGNTSVPGGQLPGGAPSIYTNPAWNATSIGCNGCHGRTTSNGYPDYTSGAAGSPSANSHSKHADSAEAGVGCSFCHNDTTTNSTSIRTDITPSEHIDGGTQDVIFDPATLAGATYTGGTKTCGTVYCHSDVQGSGGSGAPGTYASPQWGDTGPLTCGSCHIDMSTASGSGTHQAHAGSSGAGQYSCSVCHGTNYTTTTVTYPGHADKTINLSMTGNATGTTYTKTTSFPPGDGYGSCSTSNCHGDGAPTWGTTSANHTCTKCHGNPTVPGSYVTYKAAPGADQVGTDTAGDDGLPYSGGVSPDAQIGAHDAHVRAPSNISSPIPCSECHSEPTGVNDAGHIDSATPAEVNGQFGTLATTDPQTLGISPDYTAGTCSQVYCHDGTYFKNGWSTGTDPSWTDGTYVSTFPGTCDKCHGYPPSGGHSNPAPSCHSCHPHVNGTEDGFVDKTQHIDGILQATGGDACDSCHPGSSLQGRHSLHTDGATFLAGKTVSGGDYGDSTWWYDTTYINGVRKFSCGYCHPTTNANHTNGNLSYPPSGVALSLAYDDPGQPGTSVKQQNSLTETYAQSSGSVTCSSVYCHSNGYTTSAFPAHDYAYQPTPDWYGGDKGTADSLGTTTTINDSTKSGSWTTDQWIGYEVIMTSGTLGNIGQVRRVTSNTTTQLTVSPAFPAATDSGDVYELLESFEIAGVNDRCSGCHGNSPNSDGSVGSSAHGMHVVALHFKDISNGTSGQITETGGASTGAAHGDTAVSTTINCHLCHNSTVTVNYNDLNTNDTDSGSTACSQVACHGPGSANPMGAMVVDSANTAHVDGTPTLTFANVAMRVRAQMRDSTEVVDSGTTDSAGTTTTINDSTKSASWTPDQWVEYNVKMISGANAGEISQITTNTTTQLTVFPAFTNPTGSGDEYEILNVGPAEIFENWKRMNLYKAGNNDSYEQSKKALSAANYDSGTQTCSNVACHNQDDNVTPERTIQWTNTLPADANLCYNCHRRLPH